MFLIPAEANANPTKTARAIVPAKKIRFSRTSCVNAPSKSDVQIKSVFIRSPVKSVNIANAPANTMAGMACFGRALIQIALRATAKGIIDLPRKLPGMRSP